MPRIVSSASCCAVLLALARDSRAQLAERPTGIFDAQIDPPSEVFVDGIDLGDTFDARDRHFILTVGSHPIVFQPLPAAAAKGCLPLRGTVEIKPGVTGCIHSRDGQTLCAEEGTLHLRGCRESVQFPPVGGPLTIDGVAVARDADGRVIVESGRHRVAVRGSSGVATFAVDVGVYREDLGPAVIELHSP